MDESVDVNKAKPGAYVTEKLGCDSDIYERCTVIRMLY